MLREIEKVLEEDVRPYLLEHEGNVRISEYKEGILKVRLTGQCSGCPSAALTTEELIAEAVKKKISEVKDVVLVNEVSDDLIEMAKKLMSHSGKQGGHADRDKTLSVPYMKQMSRVNLDETARCVKIKPKNDSFERRRENGREAGKTSDFFKCTGSQ
ncbi:NifU family protein [Anaerostipes caccae]|uniref:NifU family protein n=1 Tax=Anaerostipes caccae TaxID=105841 RepID=UPI0038D3BE58